MTCWVIYPSGVQVKYIDLFIFQKKKKKKGDIGQERY